MSLARFQENCPRGKLPPSPNSNANPKPNPDPDREAIFLEGNFPDTVTSTGNQSQNLKLALHFQIFN